MELGAIEVIILDLCDIVSCYFYDMVRVRICATRNAKEPAGPGRKIFRLHRVRFKARTLTLEEVYMGK